MSNAPGNAADPGAQRWPGERLGLPESGPRSIGRLGRRLLALALDWALATVIAIFIAGLDYPALLPLGVFALEQIVFLAIFNGTLGHLVTGMRVVPMRPGYLGVLRPIIRTLLLCVVIPAVIFDRDQRGLHDKIPGTVLVRR